ncbi:MAG: Zn-dependent alcohol dehydrogenase [Gammaproteobacteria bacterium]|nr:Zn-dependent alcohol dehydrogenase [Gammaproteobacteria bacterium]MBQ0840597.1 Zn-dependent alcohol dehydrogenase [Gammaproteobacteria bacterium]
MKAKAVVLTGPNEYSVQEIELDPPKADEVRIRMAATGLCQSDMSVINGKLPMPTPVVLGHEGAGVIEEIGSNVTNVKVGDHVITSFIPMCGECYFCLHQEPWLCTATDLFSGMQPDGTSRVKLNGEYIGAFAALGNMAEQVVCPSMCVVAIDKKYDLKAAALVGCGVMTGAGAALNTAKVKPGSSAVIFGCGGVGLSALQGAKIAGANPLIAVDLSDEKLAAAREFGATHTVNASTDPVAQIMEITNGIGADYAFEVIGFPAVAKQAYASTRRGGTCVMVGAGSPEQEYTFSALEMPLSEKKVCGCLYGSTNAKVDFAKLLSFYETGQLDLDRMCSRTYTIDEVQEGFDDLVAGKNIRGIIVY